MGSVKREYSIRNYNMYASTRNVKEAFKYFPILKSNRLATDLMLLAFKKVKDAITNRQAIFHKLFIQELYNHIDVLDKFGYDWIFKDNSPGDIKLIQAPIIRGGQTYNLNLAHRDIWGIFEFDIVQFSIGVIYKNYYSKCSRTVLINPTERAKSHCLYLKEIERIVLYHLRDGIELHHVYQQVTIFLANRNQYLLKHLAKNIGYLINRNSKDGFAIKANSKSIAEYGMTFVITISLLELEEGKRIYNLIHADTVFVRKNEPAEILTPIPLSQQYSFIEAVRGLRNES